MQYLYMDESGSMTNEYTQSWPYFVIAIIRPESPKKLKQLYSRFVRKYNKKLMEADIEGRMFKEGKFEELKGQAFTPELKQAFADYFFRQGTMDVFYIVIDNKKASDIFYANKARAFNYVFKLAFEYFVKNGLLPADAYSLQFDERNERPAAKRFLQDYLNTELYAGGVLPNDVKVEYFDSSNNKIIQIADVSANLYYSHLRTGHYTETIQEMRASGCLKFEFRFPLITW